MKETNTLPFHLAIPVYDLEKSRDFYKNVLGCEEEEVVIIGLTLIYLVIS